MAYAIDLWKIVLDSNCSKETRINIKNGLDELNAKAKAFDKLVEFYPQKDEIPSDEFFDLMGYIIEGREVDGI
ncbi:hypothetical protein [Mammaliicoccus sp. D-M17]|uniref:hypothetical protein n=1 Tax=Mammaliicoccus sp. D-M17 TaxID=2898677 RepID=UPI001EFBFD7E|nr:hypothetical protein [Mammaliicoccus sp. D-M17]